jgi:hypothetical protein
VILDNPNATGRPIYDARYHSIHAATSLTNVTQISDGVPESAMARGNKRDRKQSAKATEAAANSVASRKIATALRKEAKRKSINGSIIIYEGKAGSTLYDNEEWTTRH